MFFSEFKSMPSEKFPTFPETYSSKLVNSVHRSQVLLQETKHSFQQQDDGSEIVQKIDRALVAINKFCQKYDT
jgi:hypothetical protein